MPNDRPKVESKPLRSGVRDAGKTSKQQSRKLAARAPKPFTPTAPARRRRRATEEVLDRIIAAATEEFERHGYTGAKTAAIAKRADVAEPLIFVHFGTKAKLFQDSIFEPLNREIVEFCAAHLASRDNLDSMETDTREYIRKLQRFIEQHSRMLLSLAMAHSYPDGSQPDFSEVDGLNGYFARARALAEQHGRQPKGLSLDLMSRLSFGAILAPIIFKNWLFPEGKISAKELSTGITEFVFAGIKA